MIMVETGNRAWPPSVPLLRAEFLTLYLVAPLLVAAMLGTIYPLMVLPVLTILAVWL